VTSASLLWGVLFGSLGAGYCLYGKRQRAPIPALCGVALIALPYLLSNTYVLVIVCAAVAAVPFVYKP